MSSEKTVPVFTRGLGRREVLQTLMAGAGVAAAVPALAHDHPVAASLQDAQKVAAADRRSQAAGYAAEFLDPHLFETLGVLAEQIVPGSRTVQVAEFLDALLAVETPETQRRFLQALGALEGLAISEHRRPYKALSAEQQIALLTKASTAPSDAPIRTQFEHLKGWISGAYYSTEAGMKELGWNGAIVFPELPACGSSAPSA